jgi:hypothetical protein
MFCSHTYSHQSGCVLLIISVERPYEDDARPLPFATIRPRQPQTP